MASVYTHSPANTISVLTINDLLKSLTQILYMIYNLLYVIFTINIILFDYYVKFTLKLKKIIVTGFGKTDHIVTIDISRNTDLKYRSRHGSLVLDCSHARFTV